MKTSMRESEWCLRHADRESRQRHLAESEKSFRSGSILVAAMLAEGKLIDEALKPLKLSHEEKIEYVAKNSVLIRSKDGHEAIQIVWANTQAICIHRLLSKEFRSEFDAYWLGVWSEALSETPKEDLVAVMTQRVKHREESRREFGVNSELGLVSYPHQVKIHTEIRA
jgi:hypothetical protein